jgi:hypothetical protein
MLKRGDWSLCGLPNYLTLVFSWIRTRRNALGPHAVVCFRKLHGAATPPGNEPG